MKLSLQQLVNELESPAGIDHRWFFQKSYWNAVPMYENFFSDIRDTALNVLEIGICDGGSIKLWHDYFPNAQIYGLDIGIIDSAKFLYDYDRISLLEGNAYTDSFIEENGIADIPFDIVIDDGSHAWGDMYYFCETYSKFLAPDGIFVLEDISPWMFSEKHRSKFVKALPDNMQKTAEFFQPGSEKRKYQTNRVLYSKNS